MEYLNMLQMQLVSLMPTLGVLIYAIISTVKIIKTNKDLRAEVRDDAAIQQIKAENRRLQAMVKDLAQIQREDKKDTDQLLRMIDEQNQTIRRMERKLGELGYDKEI